MVARHPTIGEVTPEQRGRAARALTERMEGRGLTTAVVAQDAEIDPKTVRALASGSSWATVAVRTRIEAAVDWPTGELARQARNGLEALAGFTDAELAGEILHRARQRERHQRIRREP